MNAMFVRVVGLSILLTSVLAAQGSPPSSGSKAGFEIAGTIVDVSSASPLARARVGISPSEGESFATVVTGGDGRFAFSRLAAGKYRLRAERQGYLTQSFHERDFSYSSIVVGPGSDSGNIVFPLFRECSISGAVTDETGEAVPDAQVMLFRSSIRNGIRRTSLLKSTTAGDDGSYEFGHLAVGRYFVAVSARPWYAQHAPSNSQHAASSQLDVVYPVTFYAGATEPEGAQPIELKAGDQMAVNIGLQPVPARHIHLDSSSGGSRISSVQLESLAFDGAEIPVVAETVPSSSGGVEVLGVPPGHYAVRISTTGASNRSVQSSREIEVSNNGEVETASKSPSVAAEVTLRLDSAPSLPRGASLVFSNTTTGKTFQKELNGGSELEYRQILPSGTYEVGLDDITGMYIKTISATGATVIGRTLQIKGTSAIQVAVVIGQTEGKITGVALRGDKPFPGAMVVLVPSDAGHNRGFFRDDQSDSDGSFTLPHVAPGEYTLLAIEKGWDLEWRDPAALKPYFGKGETVRVKQNGTYQIKVSVQ